MPSMLKTLFPARIPKATIVGLSLTKEEATALLDITSLLTTIIYQQLPAIIAFNHHPDHDLSPHLQAVQQRQGHFQTRLSDLIKATKDSTQPWLRELTDGQEAIIRKVQQCNRMSTRDKLGWKSAARTFWPHIADSYENVRPTLERLRRELKIAVENDALWVHNSKPSGTQMDRQSVLGRFGQAPRPAMQAGWPKKTVGFEKEVRARWVDSGEEPEKIREAKGVRMALGTDRRDKTKVDRFRARRAEVKSRTEDGGGEGEVEEIME